MLPSNKHGRGVVKLNAPWGVSDPRLPLKITREFKLTPENAPPGLRRVMTLATTLGAASPTARPAAAMPRPAATDMVGDAESLSEKYMVCCLDCDLRSKYA